jgi:thiol-disulfide isomerase/thioredoxin
MHNDSNAENLSSGTADMPFSPRSFLLPAILSALLAAAPAHAAAPEAGATADAIMAQAKSQAAAGHKNILVTFGASWCVNCRLFDKFLADPAIHPIMDKHFVFTDLDTGEMASDTKHANTPGGVKLQAALGGKDAGYPYIAMVDPSGTLLANSIAPGTHGAGGNIGYPFLPSEVDWFMQMLKKSAPSMSPEEAATVRNWLTAHGKH